MAFGKTCGCARCLRLLLREMTREALARVARTSVSRESLCIVREHGVYLFSLYLVLFLGRCFDRVVDIISVAS